MPETTNKQNRELLRDLLRQVSRSFYLSLKGLPAGVREPISIAYLLARTSDTIADTNWIPAEERLDSLGRFARRIAGTDFDPLGLESLSTGQGNPAEGTLLKKAENALELLAGLPHSDRESVRRVLATILSGQTLDLQRFAAASKSNLVALDHAGDLEDYTYRVAGCVGEFWTRICFTHLTPACSLSEPEMVELGVHYGQGLQLVNILRDLPRDLRQGRCYLPTDQLRTVDVTPTDLLDPRQEAKLRPIYGAWLERAQALLADGWTYTNAYPRTLARVRISCALPILLGWRTLDRLRVGRILDPEMRIKVSRSEVKKLVFKTILFHPFNPLWQRLAREGQADPAAE